MKKSKLFGLLTTVAVAAMFALPASGTLLVYEGFDYATGSVVGRDGGEGFDGAWQEGSDNSNQWAVQTGLTFDGLDTVGGSIKRPSAPNGADIYRTLDTTTAAALTEDNTTIWFSLVTRSTGFSFGNANGAMLFGTGAITGMSDGGSAVQMAGGEAVGFSYRGLANPNRMRLHGIMIDDGTSDRSGDYIEEDGVQAGNLYFIVGRIDWAPNGSNDTLTLYNITDPTNPVLPAPFATMSADLDQSEFNTIAIGSRQVETFDEIRFGTSLESVGVIPEPSTTGLLAVFGVAALLRRRLRR